MRQLAAEDVAEDLGVAVRVGREAGVGGDAVFVEDAQGAEVSVGGVVIVGEGEGVVGVEPAVVGVAAVAGAAQSDACVREGFRHAGFETHGLLREGSGRGA